MMPRQPYAPMPHNYVPNTALSATINVDEEVQLSTTRAERDLHDSLAELFSILVTLDELEKALLKDAVPEPEYAELCERMLKQYRSLLADDVVAAAFGDLESFKAEWDLEVPRATERIRIGVPLTTAAAGQGVGGSGAQSPAPGQALSEAPNSGGSSGNDVGSSGKLILEATQDFITFLDGVKLGLHSKDQLHPLLSEVIQSVQKVTTRDFDGRAKIIQWLITLNQMKASDALSDDQVRELTMDINQAYQGFKSTLT